MRSATSRTATWLYGAIATSPPWIAPSKYFDMFPLRNIELTPFDQSEMSIAPDLAYWVRPANWNMTAAQMKDALRAVARDLDADGGVHRFTADVFYGGGQWILLSALLGWNLAVAGDTAGAWRLLRWIADQATPDGDLPEQVAHHLLHPGSRDEWIARWGTVATPLLWSHGMYLILADEVGILSEKA